jgi:guanine nucleotide-binding protein subunit alpha
MPANSACSTIVKQMKIIHQNGYNKDELTSYRPTIFTNTMDSMRSILEFVKQAKMDFETEGNKVSSSVFLF